MENDITNDNEISNNIDNEFIKKDLKYVISKKQRWSIFLYLIFVISIVS